MLKSLRIQNYRGIADLSIEQLGRVNLIVGENNCGKTCVLEAIQLLLNSHDGRTIEEIASRRGEQFSQIRRSQMDIEESRYFDCRHIFHGRELVESISASIHGTSDTAEPCWLSICFNTGDNIVNTSGADGHGKLQNRNNDAAELSLKWNDGQLSFQGNTEGYCEIGTSSGFAFGRFNLSRSSNLVSTRGMSAEEITQHLSSIMLLSEEAFVISALQSIDETIERIAPASDGHLTSVVVNCSNQPPRIPLRSLGDGIYRMLGLALGLAASRGKVLLVDEIDSGLHYTVMEKMWKLLFETSKQLNVQVFATTHSRDCIDALASISREGVFEDSEVMIHRIEAGKSKSISYSEATIKAVAEFGNEVR